MLQIIDNQLTNQASILVKILRTNNYQRLLIFSLIYALLLAYPSYELFNYNNNIQTKRHDLARLQQDITLKQQTISALKQQNANQELEVKNHPHLVAIDTSIRNLIRSAPKVKINNFRWYVKQNNIYLKINLSSTFKEFILLFQALSFKLPILNLNITKATSSLVDSELEIKFDQDRLENYAQ